MGQVVVLDDSQTIRAVLQTWLSEAGHQVFAFATPGEVFRGLPQIQPAPDLLIIDIELNLANMDGYDVIRGIRAIPVYKEIPIMIISARDARMDEVRAKVLGVREYLVKPFTFQTFMPLVQRILAHQNEQA